MASTSSKHLAHHVFFWLKNPSSKEDLQKLIAGIQGLSKIETIRRLHVAVPAAVEQRPVVDSSYSVSELILFDDIEGHNVYQSHHIHQQFIKDHNHLWSKVVVYDSVEV